MVVCGGVWWFAVVCGGLWWIAVVCLLVIPSIDCAARSMDLAYPQIAPNNTTLSLSL